ncbi:hypothetical protein KKC45_00430 [Patescibacteria group bacterium]|nr:hypothetical protein [Patescibacteria group bacterium]
MKILKRNLTPSALIEENRLVYFGMEVNKTPEAATPKTEKTAEIDKSGKLRELKNPKTRKVIENKINNAKNKQETEKTVISKETLRKIEGIGKKIAKINIPDGIANIKIETPELNTPAIKTPEISTIKIPKINVNYGTPNNVNEPDFGKPETKKTTKTNVNEPDF